MNRIIALVIAVLVVLFVGSSMLFVVDERHVGVVTQHGDGLPALVLPGLHFKLPPPFQTLVLIDTRTLTLDEPGSDRFTTSDKNDVLVNTVIKYRVTDALKLYQSNEKNTQTAQDRLAALARTALTASFGKRALSDALAEQLPIAVEAQKAIEQPAAAFGVELVDVKLTRIDFPPAVADSVYKRMIAARQQAAGEERAKGTADADAVKADADRQKEAILADAYKEAQTVKGEGDAQAASISADAYGVDPQFYQFYQSLEAYKKTFGAGDVMVVDPNSDFFRFMRSPTGAAPVGTDATPALARKR